VRRRPTRRHRLADVRFAVCQRVVLAAIANGRSPSPCRRAGQSPPDRFNGGDRPVTIRDLRVHSATCRATTPRPPCALVWDRTSTSWSSARRHHQIGYEGVVAAGLASGHGHRRLFGWQRSRDGEHRTHPSPTVSRQWLSRFGMDPRNEKSRRGLPGRLSVELSSSSRLSAPPVVWLVATKQALAARPDGGALRGG
jgi:hypothetical protein